MTKKQHHQFLCSLYQTWILPVKCPSTCMAEKNSMRIFGILDKIVPSVIMQNKNLLGKWGILPLKTPTGIRCVSSERNWLWSCPYWYDLQQSVEGEMQRKGVAIKPCFFLFPPKLKSSILHYTSRRNKGECNKHKQCIYLNLFYL